MHIFRKDLTLWASSFMLYLGLRVPACFLSSFSSILSTPGEELLFSFSVQMCQAQNFTTPCLIPISLGRSESSSWELNRASFLSTISSPSLCGGTKSVGRMVGLWVSTLFLLSLSHSFCPYNLLKMSWFGGSGYSFLFWTGGWQDLVKHYPHKSQMFPPMALMMISSFYSKCHSPIGGIYPLYL